MIVLNTLIVVFVIKKDIEIDIYTDFGLNFFDI